MKTESKSYLFIFISGILWGTIGFFVKIMEQAGSSPAYTSFLRMFLGFLMLVVITLFKEGPGAFRISKSTLVSCVLLGVISQGVYNLVYSNAVSRIGVSMSAVLLYTAPFFTSIFSVLFFREHLGKRKISALFLNICGCILTVTGGDFSAETFLSVGVLFGVAAGICYSLTPIFGRMASGEGSPFAIAAYNFLFASVFLCVFVRPWTTVEDPLDAGILAAGFGFALIPTALGYIFYFGGLKNIRESSKVPVIASVETVVAAIIGIFFFREDLSIVHLLGMIGVLGSIAVMNGKATEESK